VEVEDGTDGTFVLPLAASKGKVVGAGARTVVSTPGCIGARDVRIWTKTWRKALVDENKDSEDIDDSAMTMTILTNPSTLAWPDDAPLCRYWRHRHPSEVTSFYHHCRSKTKQPKIMFIRESTGMKLYCDRCIEKQYVRFFSCLTMHGHRELNFFFFVRYPNLTFDELPRRFRVRVVTIFAIALFARVRVERLTYPNKMEFDTGGDDGLAPASATAMTADNSSSPQSRTISTEKSAAGCS
jgi:hypothetical protein